MPRTANIIKPADHAIWAMREADELLDYVRNSFPQLPEPEGFVSRAEAEAFVAARPGAFPAPRFVRQLAARRGRTGVVLLGDAAHSFPPDVGQGVNAALEDVGALAAALGGGAGATARDDDAALDAALARYQAERAPAAEALARIVRVAFPYQYDQSFWRSKLFLAGFAARLGLSKLGALVGARALFAPPAAFGVLAAEPYVEIWRRAQRTTRALQAAAIACLALVLRRVVLKV